MQYLLNEVHGRISSTSGEVKAFNSVLEAIKHLQKINKGTGLLVGDKAANVETVQALLKERLSTVSISLENQAGEEAKTWTIIAF